MVTRRVAAAALGFGAVFAAGCARGPAPGDLAGWNVLLITIDTLRADRLGFAGWSAAETPVLDALAEEGVVFSTTVATAPVTLPSHASMLTGLYPPAHGALDNGVYALPDDVPTLATVLKDAGYETAAVIGAYVLHRQYGLARGFDHYDDRFRRPSLSAARERSGDQVAESAVHWLRDRKNDGPFLLWTHFYDPHAPYDPPAKFRHLADPYDGEIAYVDACIGRLLAGLRAAGELERTLVIVTADHGEALGDGGERTHGLLLRESTLRVPWILRANRALPARRVAESVASVADIMPTVLDLIGLPVPGSLDGLSMIDAIRGGASPDRIVYSETRLPRDEFGWSDLSGARDRRWARVVGPIPETYDLAEDPQQQENLDGSELDVERRLDAAIEGVRAAMRDGGRRTLTSGETEALRSLGYVVTDAEVEYTGADPKTRVGIFDRTTELGDILDQRRFDEVLAGAEAVLREDPHNRVARSLRGQALVGLGRFEEGLQDLETTLANTRSFGHDGTILARSLAAAGRVDEAERLLRSFIEVQPDYAEHRFNLGVLLSGQGRQAEAVVAYEEAARANPMGVHILSNLAMTLMRLGRQPDRALELIDRAVALAGSEDDRPKLLRLDVLHGTGRTEEAMDGVRELQRRPRLRGASSTELAEMLRRWQADQKEVGGAAPR